MRLPWGYQGLEEFQFNALCQEVLGKNKVYFQKRMLPEMYHVMEGEKSILIQSNDLENKTYLALQNGLLNLENYQFMEHTPDVFITAVLPYAYDPDASCPRFEQFLEEIFEEDEKRIQFAQEMMGYALHPFMPTPGLFFLYGSGANGKSVLLEVIRQMVGDENCVSINLDQLMRDENYLACLKGKKVNVVNENNHVYYKEAALLKSVTSAESIMARKIYGQPTNFQPYCKHFIALNEYPVFREKTEAIRRRVRILAFNRIFSEKEQDVDLTGKLLKELPGILNYALVGLNRLKSKKFIFTELVSVAESLFFLE